MPHTPGHVSRARYNAERARMLADKHHHQIQHGHSATADLEMPLPPWAGNLARCSHRVHEPAAIEQLPPGQLRVWLAARHGQNVDQIAAAMGIPLRAAQALLQAAAAKMRGAG